MRSPLFTVVPLNRQHLRAGFCCGTETLDQYFANRVGQDIRRNLAKCFIALDHEEEKIAGFYTLSAAQIPLSKLPPQFKEKLPRYDSIPASRLGRLAIDRNYQGQGLGSVLIADALKRSMESSMAVYALLVDAKDIPAAAFYRHHGFIPCEGTPHILFLPLGNLHKL
jgi:GNAT superfamily N-acetyltransferase